MSNVVLTTPNELKTLVTEWIKEKQSVYKHWIESKLIEIDKPLTKQEAAEYLAISQSTLYRWTKKGIIKAHGIEDKTYYMLSEIKSAMKPIN